MIKRFESYSIVFLVILLSSMSNVSAEGLTITNPVSNGVYPKSTLKIKAKIDLDDLSSVIVEYSLQGKNDWHSISGVSSSILANGTEELIADWDLSLLQSDEFYDLRITCHRSSAEDLVLIEDNIHVSEKMLQGFPINFSLENENLESFYLSPSVEVADLDNDNQKEIITLLAPEGYSYDDTRVATPELFIHSSNGDLVLSKKLKSPSGQVLDDGHASKIVVADLNGDGNKDIVVSSLDRYENQYIFAIDSQGNDLPGFPLNLPWDPYDSEEFAPMIADLDRDGTPELILFATRSMASIYNPVTETYDSISYLLIVDNLGQIKNTIQVPGAGFFNDSFLPGVGNFDEDLDLEIVVPSGDKKIAVYNQDGSLVEGFPVSISDFGKLGPGLVIADVNNDNYDEIGLITDSFGDSESHLLLIDRHGQYLPGFPKNLSSCNEQSLPSFADLDSDGDLEIFLRSDYYLHLYNHDGTALLGWPKYIDEGLEDSVLSGSIADINADGHLDLIVLSEGDNNSPRQAILAWNINGTPIDLNLHLDFKGLVRENGFPVDHTGVPLSPIVDDIDGDGSVEILYPAYASNNRASIYAWHTGFTPEIYESAPSTPESFYAESVSLTEIELSWSESVDNTEIAHYNIYRSDNPLVVYQTVTGTEFSETINMISNSTGFESEYSYQVSAVDLAGNESAKTTSLKSKIVNRAPQSLNNVDIVAKLLDFNFARKLNTSLAEFDLDLDRSITDIDKSLLMNTLESNTNLGSIDKLVQIADSDANGLISKKELSRLKSGFSNARSFFKKKRSLKSKHKKYDFNSDQKIDAKDRMILNSLLNHS